MGLTSTVMLVLAAVLSVAAPLIALLLWNRLPGPRFVRAGQRVSLLISGQACAVLFAFLAVNDQYLFFTSWPDLLGTQSSLPPIVAVGGQHLLGPSGGVTIDRESSQIATDGGQLIAERVHGDRSGVTATVLVHLPPGYATSNRRYPVLELLPGWRGVPASWLRNFHVLQAMAAVHRQGALADVITIMPTLNVAAPRDVECTDVPHGSQAETWLTTDVRDLALSRYRALPSSTSWAVMGYSTGGYCAAKIVLQHPKWYGTAVSLAGYFDAIKDNTTGDLWGGSALRRNENSPLWLVQHRPIPAVNILAFSSKEDPESYASTAAFLVLARPPLQVFSLIVPAGGHNLKAISRNLPQVLAWIGGHLTSSQRPATLSSGTGSRTALAVNPTGRRVRGVTRPAG